MLGNAFTALRNAMQLLITAMAGVGSGTGLMEASIILHLSAVLCQPVDLSCDPVTFILPRGGASSGTCRIIFLATETPDLAMQQMAHVDGAGCRQMAVQMQDRRTATRAAAARRSPMVIFWSWMPTANR